MKKNTSIQIEESLHLRLKQVAIESKTTVWGLYNLAVRLLLDFDNKEIKKLLEEDENGRS